MTSLERVVYDCLAAFYRLITNHIARRPNHARPTPLRTLPRAPYSPHSSSSSYTIGLIDPVHYYFVDSNASRLILSHTKAIHPWSVNGSVSNRTDMGLALGNWHGGPSSLSTDFHAPKTTVHEHERPPHLLYLFFFSFDTAPLYCTRLA